MTAIGTYLQDASRGLYKLYVVDPSEQQIHAYSPAADGGGFPAKPEPWLATARDVSGITSLLIDGDLYATEHGLLEKYTSGKDNGWKAKPPGDDLLRPAPTYTLSSGPNLPADRDKGVIYVYDGPNARIVAIEKASNNSSGAYKAQYRLAGHAPGWEDLRGMVVDPGRGRRAGERAVDLGRRPPPGVARGRPGRGDGQPVAQPVRRAVGEPEGHHEAEADRRSRPRSRRAAGP